ncbi:MAG: glycoside hydrolase family 88 protein, partial [Tannerella sp.]|nr:glycoside hydrolase family 88 protein [Tannerella sp.]
MTAIIFAPDLQAQANNSDWFVRMADSEMKRNPESWMLDFSKQPKWNYCHGLVLDAILQTWQRTGNMRYFDYAKAYADTMLNADGSINTYKPDEYNIDRINSGKILFAIYSKTGDEKYKKALQLLRNQMTTHPRTSDGGFWHKKIYPHQMWLDGIYMASPFLAQYASVFNEPALYDEVTSQILTIAKHTYDPNTGLYYHGWDESREQQWANKETGCSPNFWSRSIGWYMMAIVDVLDYLPENHHKREAVIKILKDLSAALEKYRDKQTGLWYQVTDKPDTEGNYVESTGSAMFIYTYAKGAKKGYLDASYLEKAREAFEQYLKTFIRDNADGTISVIKCCAVAGLGGTPYRDGSYNYYINETIRDDDPKATAPFIFAALWLKGYTVVVDRNGRGDFRNVTDAINSVRAFDPDNEVTIYIRDGFYKEKIELPTYINNVKIIGESRDHTVISYDDHANIPLPKGYGNVNMGTFRTYTFLIRGNNITIENLTIENSSLPLGQAVALHLEGDNIILRNCRLLGNQDTVYAGRDNCNQYFYDCYIEGTTDFIFGPSTCRFDNCVIHCKKNSYITAASTPENVAVGFVFNNCRITVADGVDAVYLGRPWRPYAMTAFVNCDLPVAIRPEGWHNWGKESNEKTARYYEYNNTGKGADTKKRVKWAKQMLP